MNKIPEEITEVAILIRLLQKNSLFYDYESFLTPLTLYCLTCHAWHVKPKNLFLFKKGSSKKFL